MHYLKSQGVLQVNNVGHRGAAYKKVWELSVEDVVGAPAYVPYLHIFFNRAPGPEFLFHWDDNWFVYECRVTCTFLLLLH